MNNWPDLQTMQVTVQLGKEAYIRVVTNTEKQEL